MRTKADKERKKAASQRLQFNASLPMVVLDASDCAKLLDGTGKTSVVVVERGGKIVPVSSSPEAAVSSSSSPPTSSESLSSSSSPPPLLSSSPSTSFAARLSSGALTSKSKLCKNPSRAPPCNLDRNTQKSVVAKEDSSLSNYVTESSSPEKGKMILKPPKKRRGNDKGAYENLDTQSSVINGETSHQIVSPLRDLTRNDVSDLGKTLGSSSSFPTPPPDSLQKHTIENLLQTQTSTNNNNCTNSKNNLISGKISHRPYESLSSHQSSHSAITGTPVHTPVTVLSSLQTPLPSVSPPSTSLSASQPTAIPRSSPSINYLSSTHQGMSDVGDSSSLLYCSSLQPVANQPIETHPRLLPHYISSNEKEPDSHPSSIVPSSLSPKPASRNTFQILPEQDEPMNLSTSSKVALGLSPEHCEVTVENDMGMQMLHSPIVRSGSKINLSDSISQNSSDLLKNNPIMCTTESDRLSLGQHVQDISVTNSVISPLDRKLETAEEPSRASSIIEPLPSVKSPCHAQSPTVPQSSVKLINEAYDNKSKSSEEPDSLGGQATLVCDIKAPLGKNVEKSSCTAQIPSPPLSISYAVIASSTDMDSGIDESKNCIGCDKETGVSDILSAATSDVKAAPLKFKKPPKKRLEIPMDEESCAGRLTRYTGSIDYVITDFVFNPEPVEEISLTEEEEAIIREQFEDDKTNRAADKKVEDGTLHNGISKAMDTSDLVKENSENASSPSLHTDDATDTVLNGKDHVLKPPKKRNAVKSAHSKKSSEEALSAIANLESVVSFVVGDITNFTPPSEEGLLELDEKYGHILKKKKKKVDSSVQYNHADDKQLEENTSSSPEKKIKTAERTKTPQREDIAAPGKSIVQQQSVATSTESLENEEIRVPARTPKVAKLKSKSKEPKKRKLDSLSAPVQSTDVSKSEEKVSLTDDTASKPKKKKLEGKTKSQKKKKSEKRENISTKNLSNSSGPPVEERDHLSSVKMETSDLGESIASTSCGSEQVTPVHELETKDESTSTDAGMDKENHDTGADSSTDDKEKPVRHYKRRLDFVKCSQCDHQARGRSALSRHMKKVHLVNVDMPYKCTICTYGCTKMASLNRHLFTHGIFPCSRCDYKTDKRDKLVEHIAEQHKDKLDMKLCKICNRYIKCESVTIEDHSENCKGPTPYKCTECDKEFKYGSSLRVHYHTHFPDQPKRFKCELCDYKTNYKANLHKHHKNMHASKDRDIQCPDCGKMFSTEDNMRRHRKVHTLARPFACETCKKTFKTSGALKGHQLIHTATRPFTCNIPGCNRSFRTPKFLKSHQEEFHRLVPKKFFCQVEGCNYSFFKRSHLKRHAITHTGERNFHCNWPGCCKSFRHADNLKVHFRSHTNEKPVQCHLCDFKCKQKNSLFWHKKKVHQIVDASTVLSKRVDSAEVKNVDGTSLKDVNDSDTSQSVEGEETVETVSKHVAVGADKKMEGKRRTEVDENSLGANDSRDNEKEDGSCTTKVVKDIKASMSGGKDREPADLYEFKSDGESEEEGISPLRREKIKTAALPPLPPPPKELLLKNEMLEQKEREKHEKAEKKEQEKREKADRKEQEKKEKAEKKEMEKKEKAEKREIEKKMKEEKRELEKKDREEKRLQLLQEKVDKREREKKEKTRKRLEVKRLKLEARKILQKGSALMKKKNAAMKLKKEAAQASTPKTASSAKEKKSKALNLRSKSPARGKLPVKSEPATKKGAPGRKKKISNVAEDTKTSKTNPGEKEEDLSVACSTRRRRTPSSVGKSKEEKPKPQSRSSSPRAASKKSPPQKKTAPAKAGHKKTAAPPKRKPSARIKANKVAKTKKTAKVTAKKTAKTGAKKIPGRKKSLAKSKQSAVNDKGDEDAEEDEVEEEEVEEENASAEKSETEKKTTDDNESLKSASTEIKEKTSVKEEEDQVPSRPASPAYSEEIMVQGKASPYRDFSDAEIIEEKDAKENQESQLGTPLQSPKEDNPIHTSQDEPVNEEGDDGNENADVNHEEERAESCTFEESSDDEVINDIPLTPPRAPAPPPMESSEDEMEPEQPDKVESCQPFSVPAPSTPFSVPGPNTPFSVPPPTNLMQQHSVHSEELPSVASMEMPSVEMHQGQGSVELHPHGSVELHPHGSVEILPHGSVERHPHGSVELHPHGSVEMHPHGSVEMHPHGSVEMHPHSSVEMHPHGSVEMHPHGSVEMHPHGSVEMHPHSSVEMHSHSSVERHPHSSVEIHPNGSVELHPHGSVEMHANSSVEMNQAHGSVEMQLSHSSISEPLSQADSQMPQSNLSVELPPTPREVGPSSLTGHDKYSLPPVLDDEGQSSEADRKCFDQYLKNLNMAHSNMECSPPSGLQQLEAMVDKSHPDTRDLMNKSPHINHHHPAMPTSVITSLENNLSTHIPQTELRSRIDPLAERHHEALYARESVSVLPRLPERQSTTPLLTNHATPAPAFDTFSPLNPLHPSSASSRDNAYLRQQDTIFATPPVTSSFMAEAMFQRQAMTTPFLPPAAQPADRSTLSRISDPASSLRTNNTSSLLRRPATMPGTEMFTTPAVPQTMPRHPFTNVWPGQEMRQTHWQSPYLPRQPNMGHANSPFFPPKENYLTGREFMFDPSSAVRSSTERGMFSSLSSSQSQDSFQMDRFDISNYFPNAMTPYGSSTGTLDYTRSTHSAAPKPFDERYRQTAAVASAAIPEFRGLPPTTAAPEMFPSIGMNSSFNLYPSNPMSYHPQHMTDNMNSAFLTHSSSAQHAMLERDYAAAAAHRSLYPHHQNAAYPFIDERQYSGSSKLAASHPAPATATQERDLMSRTAASAESQMQDPYRSMLYRY